MFRYIPIYGQGHSRSGALSREPWMRCQSMTRILKMIYLAYCFQNGRVKCKVLRTELKRFVGWLMFIFVLAAGGKRHTDVHGPLTKMLRSDSERLQLGRTNRSALRHTNRIFDLFSQLSKRKHELHVRGCFLSNERVQISSSQPEPQGLWEIRGDVVHTEGAQVSFSQPACPDHMLLGSQLLGTPGASQVIALHHMLHCVRLFTSKHTGSGRSSHHSFAVQGYTLY